MDPVNVHILDTIGEMTAAVTIAFGAAVCRSAASTVKGAPNTTAGEENLLGIAVEDMIEKEEDGFYSQYDAVPIATEGRARVWVTPDTLDASVIAGDYLSLIVLGGGSNALPVGVFGEIGGDGAVKDTNASARALEDVTLTSAANYIIVGADLAVGGATVTIADSSKFTVGDYIVLEDLDGSVMMNRVKAIPSSTTITLQLVSTVALGNGVDYVHILAQCEVKLL